MVRHYARLWRRTYSFVDPVAGRPTISSSPVSFRNGEPRILLLNKFSLAQFEEEEWCRGEVDDQDTVDATNSIIAVGENPSR